MHLGNDDIPVCAHLFTVSNSLRFLGLDMTNRI